MIKNTTTIAILLAALSVSGASVLAGQVSDGSDETKQRHEHRQRGRDFDGPGFLSERAAEFLDLDESQTVEVRNVLEAARPEFDALRQRGRDLRQALVALDPADADYGSALQNLSVESGQVATDLTLLHGRVRAEVNAILTPEQREMLAEKLARFGERGRRGPWPGAR